MPYPGCLIVYYGWKQDDYTSVATIAGATSLMENDSTLGSDAGQVVQAVAQSAAANIAAGSMVVTGGGAAISRGVVLALRTTTQVAAVSARAVNGVAKAHSAGAQVRLWHAPVRAL